MGRNHAAAAATKVIHSISYGVLAAACGGYSQLFLKIFTTAIRMSVDDNNPQFGKYEVYVCIVGLIVTAVVQLWAMNQALRGNLYYLATSVYQSLLVVCPILVGATFYDELKGLDALHLAMFFAGQGVVILALVSLVFLQSPTSKTAAEENVEPLSLPKRDSEMSVSQRSSINSERRDGPDPPPGVLTHATPKNTSEYTVLLDDEQDGTRTCVE